MITTNVIIRGGTDLSTIALRKWTLAFDANWKMTCPVRDGIARNSIQADPVNGTVTSNAPHMNRLNHGWSKQAPSGFIEAAADKASRDINRL